MVNKEIYSLFYMCVIFLCPHWEKNSGSVSDYTVLFFFNRKKKNSFSKYWGTRGTPSLTRIMKNMDQTLTKIKSRLHNYFVHELSKPGKLRQLKKDIFLASLFFAVVQDQILANISFVTFTGSEIYFRKQNHFYFFIKSKQF